MTTVTTDEKIKQAVRKTYGDIARRFDEEPVLEPRGAAGCCGPAEELVVESTGIASAFYSDEELTALPDSAADAALGCGNPTAIAALQPGEVVLDLGSGGGIDCFLAAQQVGPGGRVIGLDMTTDMIKLARRNAKKIGATNVDFRYGEMEDIPLPDASVDVVISNCVVNLSPDKDAVFGEVCRVLRPGGRVMVSDMVTDGEIPAPLRERMDAWAGCVGGALDEALYLDKIRAAGFENVKVTSRNSMPFDKTHKPADQPIEEENAQIIVMGPDGPVEGAEARAMLAQAGVSVDDLAQTVASINVEARKPASTDLTRID